MLFGTVQAALMALDEEWAGRNTVLYYAAVFFVIAIIAAVFGFTGIAVGAAGIARILFFLFLIGAAIALLMGGFRRA